LIKYHRDNLMHLDMHIIDERIAKAKEELIFWENARIVLLDPRIVQLAPPAPPAAPAAPAAAPATPPAQDPPMGTPSAPRVYGELKQKVYSVLPDFESNQVAPIGWIIQQLGAIGYVFKAKDPSIAVNGALVSLQEQGLVESPQKKGNTKFWRKKPAINQEAPEGAS
jgi:hypothetical protein